MTSKSEYDDAVRRWKSASVGLFVALAVSVALLATGHAQVNAPPASVTSPGFGGRAINGAPASVTSLGANGYTQNSRVTFSGGSASSTTGDGHHHHRRDLSGQNDRYIGEWYAVPYAIDLSPQPDAAYADDDDDPEYQGGPTVFDRRGSGEASYVPPVKDMPHPHAQAAREDDSDEPTPQIQTSLVFKDGHDIEVGNYAIVGDTLFDLTPGHARRVAIADLDLDATRKKNDDRGVMFEVPSMQQAN
jgi:hypothetical protein